MKTNHPNRLRQQVSQPGHVLQKKSGDQRLAAPDSEADLLHRPHRLNRLDMQNIDTKRERIEEE